VSTVYPDRYGKPRKTPLHTTRKDTTMIELADLADRLAQVQEQLAPLRDLETALKAEMRSTLATLGPGEYQAGNHVVVAGATRRLDQTLIQEHYPATTHPQFYKLTIDTAAVRRELAPAVIDEHMTTAGDMKITVK